MKHALILGGGMAGLSAAMRLRRHADALTLLEARPRFGGRSYSFTPREGWEEIDNGQHVLMGCCASTLAYLADCGTAQLLDRRRGLALEFVHADGRRARLGAGSLPHPLGIAQAFLGFGMLTLSARMRILRVATRLRSLTPAQHGALDTQTVTAWLRALGQDEKSIACFWRPVVLATMNSDIDCASAKLFATVLREIFLGAPEGADMLLPRAGLTPLLVDGALAALREAGADLQLHASAEEILHRDGNVIGVRMKDGDVIEGDAVIIAMPPWALQRLAEASGLEEALGIDFERFIPSEILSIHFRSRRDLGLQLMTGLLETRLHWIFDKGAEDSGAHRYSATISAAPDDLPRDAESLRRILVDELRLAVPDLQDDDITDILPIREKRATFVPLPGMEAYRPAARTSIDGLFLAGDWTDTGLPATIESAVRSGHAAADVVMERS
jgi:squalene-associated FAD-dependent desaturase